MTRKHFIDIAKTLHAQLVLADGKPEAEEAVIKTARALCDDFKAINRAFDRERFMHAVIN